MERLSQQIASIHRSSWSPGSSSLNPVEWCSRQWPVSTCHHGSQKHWSSVGWCSCQSIRCPSVSGKFPKNMMTCKFIIGNKCIYLQFMNYKLVSKHNQLVGQYVYFKLDRVFYDKLTSHSDLFTVLYKSLNTNTADKQFANMNHSKRDLGVARIFRFECGLFLLARYLLVLVVYLTADLPRRSGL